MSVLCFDWARSFNAWNNSKSIVNAYETYQQCYIPAGVNNNQIRTLKPPVVLENINHNDANNYALSILNQYENRLDYLDELCLAVFASSYISKKVIDNS